MGPRGAGFNGLVQLTKWKIIDMKVVTIVGARPQFIKAAAVSRVFRDNSAVDEVLVHTGQHFDADMSDVFFEQLEIPAPKHNLGISGVGHGAMTGRMMEKIETVLLDEKPDMLLVYGDTNSTLAGSLAATKISIPVAHVEAGLRSFNRSMPEEINRVLTDHMSNYLFCPTSDAVNNLSSEGITGESVVLVGDVMLDAANYFSEKPIDKNSIVHEIKSNDYILATIHRQENTADVEKFISILNFLESVNKHTNIVFQVHPRVASLVAEYKKRVTRSGILFVPPMGYLEMVQMQKNSVLIITDSGGLQKEAYFFKKPCVTLRSETEWVELVNAGWNVLLDPSDSANLDVSKVLARVGTTGDDKMLYGDGSASRQIMDTLLS